MIDLSNQEIANNITQDIYNPDYNSRANHYDEEIVLINRRACDVVAHLVNVFIDDKNARILDIAAGTGLVAIALQRYGFTNMDGLDPSAGMLDKAKEKNLYHNYYYEGIYADKKTSVPDELYDHVLCCASMDDDGLIKFESIEEFLRMMKSGGYGIIVDRDSFYLKSQQTNEKLFTKLEEEKKLKLITNFSFRNYIKNELVSLDGRALVFQKI
ncbi:Williams-Beuren syndrome chromosomal region 27 [Brachionus plicatilis]|uniref:Williams-Beuren syndrome chromosomal region 27 n=1 Tax=Brachionus plicatilis TaxID=10195 RepID=A0A3M7T922_BRAPC|nr:Williams-Beuren syndrome chromosomal region 27 [Brachionus plicatilis]